MITWVLYDIKDDRSRNKAAKFCKQAGLYRVQFSAFIGQLDSNQRDALTLRLEGQIDVSCDKVYILPMSSNEMKQTILLGQAFDKKYISDEVKALFL